MRGRYDDAAGELRAGRRAMSATRPTFQFTQPVRYVEAMIALGRGDLLPPGTPLPPGWPAGRCREMRYAWPLVWLGMRAEADEATRCRDRREEVPRKPRARCAGAGPDRGAARDPGAAVARIPGAGVRRAARGRPGQARRPPGRRPPLPGRTRTSPTRWRTRCCGWPKRAAPPASGSPLPGRSSRRMPSRCGSGPHRSPLRPPPWPAAPGSAWIRRQRRERSRRLGQRRSRWTSWRGSG